MDSHNGARRFTTGHPRPDEGRGPQRAPLTNALLATVDTRTAVRVELNGVPEERLKGRLRVQMKRYGVRLVTRTCPGEPAFMARCERQ